VTNPVPLRTAPIEVDDVDQVDDVDAAPKHRQVGMFVDLDFEDGTSYRVRTVNRDRIAYEKAAAKHKEWPGLEQGPNFAMTFLCWHAARREGRTTLGFEQFAEVLEDYNTVREAVADPTR